MKLTYQFLPLILSLGLMGCGSDQPTQSASKSAETEIDDFVIDEEYGDDLPDSAPIYTVSTAAHNPPFESKDEYGSLNGFDIDLIKAIGATQGFKVQVVHDSDKNLLSNLDKNTRDIVIAGLDYDASQSSTYGISDPYYFSSTVIVYTNPKLNINGVDDLISRKLGIVTGTSLPQSVADQLGSKEIKEYNSNYLAIKALVAEEVDAVAANEESMRHLIRERPEFSPEMYRIEGSIADFTQKVIYVSNENAELLNAINAGIQQVVENGNYGEISVKWIGSEKSREYSEKMQALQDFDNSLDSSSSLDEVGYETGANTAETNE